MVNWAHIGQVAGTLGLAGITSTVISRKKVSADARHADVGANLQMTEAQVKA